MIYHSFQTHYKVSTENVNKPPYRLQVMFAFHCVLRLPSSLGLNLLVGFQCSTNKIDCLHLCTPSNTT